MRDIKFYEAVVRAKNSRRKPPLSRPVDYDGGNFMVWIEEIKSYVLVTQVNNSGRPYLRYYRVDEEDAKLVIPSPKRADGLLDFRKKYRDELSGHFPECCGERFIGSMSLRDYDAEEHFQDAFPCEGSPFVGYGYEDGVLYAKIWWDDMLPIYVPPKKIISKARPLRDKCKIQWSAQGEPICWKRRDVGNP